MRIGRLVIEKRTDQEIREWIEDTRSGPDGVPGFGQKYLDELDKKAARKGES